MTRYRSHRNRIPITFAAIIVIAAIALTFSPWGGLFGLRSLFISAVYPLQLTAAAVWKTAVGFPSAVASLRNLARNNAEMKEKLKAATARLNLYEELRQENERLREALGFRGRNRYGFKLISAKVLGRAASSWDFIVEVDRGASSGVRKDMPVVVKNGLVGSVLEVTPFVSKVLLISDPACAVAAVDQRSRDFGVVEGLSMKYVAGDADIKPGDAIVTSSISSLFPAGIPIGTVISARKKEADLFYSISVKPAVDFSKIEEVFVIGY